MGKIMKDKTEKLEKKALENKLNSLKLTKPSDIFDSRMNELFADAKYYSKHNKSKTIYFWMGAVAASFVIVFVLAFYFNFENTAKVDSKLLSNPDYINRTPITASIINIDKSDRFFTISRRDQLKDIFNREVMSVSNIN
jgi:hypothetical protein